MKNQSLIDPDLIRRYDRAGPRYTSYPAATHFNEDFTAADFCHWARQSNHPVDHGKRPLSLYVHIPFCSTLCFYCGCNKVVTRNRQRAIPYLEHLHREIELHAGLFDHDRPVDQMHWGGGTPTFINPDQMHELVTKLKRHFRFHNDDSGEYAIEIDPREVDDETVGVLREMGFNRISLGVQDTNPLVQQAVNRIQPVEQTLAVIQAARRHGFKSISIDLIYGLPRQTPDTFAATIEAVLAMNPDRISLFNYAHLPALFKPQRKIAEQDLPPPRDKLAILKNSVMQLCQAGYRYIGMDHFARPDDDLAIAQQNGTLYRNFQGYSTHKHCDLVAMGITAISQVGPTYSQNAKTLDDYYERIDRGELPIVKGRALTRDDLIRRALITELICHFHVGFESFSRQWQIDSKDYFARELQALSPMQDDGLVAVTAEGITVLDRGRYLIRNICMVFDIYLRNPSHARYSKVI